MISNHYFRRIHELPSWRNGSKSDLNFFDPSSDAWSLGETFLTFNSKRKSPFSYCITSMARTKPEIALSSPMHGRVSSGVSAKDHGLRITNNLKLFLCYPLCAFRPVLSPNLSASKARRKKISWSSLLILSIKNEDSIFKAVPTFILFLFKPSETNF